MPNYNYPYQYPQYGYQVPQTQTQPQAQQFQNVQQLQMQIQNGGLVSVHNEVEARNYPVGIGTSVTFKDENAPYVYTKTMGFSQLDSPTFEKYRLVKEDATTPENEVLKDEGYKLSYDELKAEIEALQERIKALEKSGERRIENNTNDKPRNNQQKRSER